ncbi:MAG: response regulator transcription factor [Treponema sp.]|nr:response regulator transcription factor [Spirochaetales bacterium]MDY4902288.1 response regulator transcription factor [Treponema sp.]
MKQKITIIEDNKDMSELIKTFLSDDGFETVQYFSAESALEGFEKDNTDLFILDINLPGMNGFDFLTELRKVSNLPVLILSARSADVDIVNGLGIGADDFMSKPFSSSILLARVHALLRRVGESSSQGKSNAVEKFGDFEFDSTTLTLSYKHKALTISMRECRLLDYLIKNKGQPVLPEKIYSDVWKNTYGDITIVGVYIQRLRRKIEDDPSNPKFILTKNGSGYYFQN